jgi:hypothetical protein
MVLWDLSASCFHGDETEVSASLQGQKMPFLEDLLCFKRAHHDIGIEYPFGTAVGNDQTSLTGWKFSYASPASLSTKSLIWSDPVNCCESVWLFLLLLLPSIGDCFDAVMRLPPVVKAANR